MLLIIASLKKDSRIHNLQGRIIMAKHVEADQQTLKATLDQGDMMLRSYGILTGVPESIKSLPATDRQIPIHGEWVFHFQTTAVELYDTAAPAARTLGIAATLQTVDLSFTPARFHQEGDVLPTIAAFDAELMVSMSSDDDFQQAFLIAYDPLLNTTSSFGDLPRPGSSNKRYDSEPLGNVHCWALQAILSQLPRLTNTYPPEPSAPGTTGL
jgi:hypothetical protein